MLNQQGLPSGRRQPLTLSLGVELPSITVQFQPSSSPCSSSCSLLLPPASFSLYSSSFSPETRDVGVFCDLAVGTGELLNGQRQLVGLKKPLAFFRRCTWPFHHHYLRSTYRVYFKGLLTHYTGPTKSSVTSHLSLLD